MDIDNINDKIDELITESSSIVASPETFEQLKKKGLKIESTFQTYEEYIEKLFDERKKFAKQVIYQLPRLDDNLHNSTIRSLYDEIKECFVLGIPGAGITLASILLELALKYRLFDKRRSADKNAVWEHIEQLDFKKTVNQLTKLSVINKKDKKELDRFSDEVRNAYAHYNIQKLVNNMIISELPILDVNTGKVVIKKDVNPKDNPALWFSAKKVMDQKTVVGIVGFCIGWTNTLLVGQKNLIQ